MYNFFVIEMEGELLKQIEELKARIAELESKQQNQHKPPKQLPEVECEICHKTFKNKYILKTHMKNMHDETRTRFDCPHCDKTFANKYYLKKHIAAKHGDKHEEETHEEEEQ